MFRQLLDVYFITAVRIVRENVRNKANQTVNDGVAHSKNPKKLRVSRDL